LGIQNKGSCEEVRWLGRSLCSYPSAAAGLVPSIGFFGFQRERERERCYKGGEEKPSPPCLCASKGRR